MVNIPNGRQNCGSDAGGISAARHWLFDGNSEDCSQPIDAEFRAFAPATWLVPPDFVNTMLDSL